MTNKDAWSIYEDYTRIISTIVRSHSLGAIAVCWIFKNENGLSIIIKFALLLAALSLVADALQYFIAAIKNKKWIREREVQLADQSGSIEGEYSMPQDIDIWPYRLFKIKIYILFSSFALIAIYIFLEL